MVSGSAITRKWQNQKTQQGNKDNATKNTKTISKQKRTIGFSPLLISLPLTFVPNFPSFNIVATHMMIPTETFHMYPTSLRFSLLGTYVTIFKPNWNVTRVIRITKVWILGQHTLPVKLQFWLENNTQNS